MASASNDPVPGEVEQLITPLVDSVIQEAKTGYNWKEVDDILISHLGIRNPRCKKASGSGRAANVLTESNDKAVDLYMVFITGGYDAQKFTDVAINRVQRFPNVQTVAVAEKIDKTWRVTRMFERRGIDLAQKLKPNFPFVGEITYVDAVFDLEEPVGAVDAVDLEFFEDLCRRRTTTWQDYGDLVEQFAEFLKLEGIIASQAVQLDLLASVLSNQFLLFAGPSGTGKSTLARALGRFFSGREAFQTVEGARKWIGPEDVVGYYSNISGRYASTTNTEKLLALHEASTSLANSVLEVECPYLLVEEMNLSPIEGYLNPWTHGLSAGAAPVVVWRLHANAKHVEQDDELIAYPPTLVFGPFPRLVGTLNVDQESAAPAKKVISRATVILLEVDDAVDITEGLFGLTNGAVSTQAGAGAQWLGDPLTALQQMDQADKSALLNSYQKLVAQVDPEGTVIKLSFRQRVRIAAYMAYFLGLASAVSTDLEEAKVVAAENCLLHFVLPLLDPEAFRSVVSRAQVGFRTTSPIGGLLKSRIAKLTSLEDRDQFDLLSVDFWSALA